MTLLILVVDDEPDVELLFSAPSISGATCARSVSRWNLLNPVTWRFSALLMPPVCHFILILSDINMPGMTGLELLPKAKAARPDVPVIMISCLWRCGHQAQGSGGWC